MRKEGGFGIVTVMIGATVLGIFALVYTQKMQNRANVSLISDLMSFREQVITYYSSVVANRGTWECTVQNNADLRHYLAKSFEAWPTGDKRRLAGEPPQKDGDLSIYNYSGACQEKFGAAAGTLIIPAGGFGLEASGSEQSPLRARACLQYRYSPLLPEGGVGGGLTLTKQIGVG